MNIRDIETLVDLAHVAHVSEITLRSGGRRITIRKDDRASSRPTAGTTPVEILGHDRPVEGANGAKPTAQPAEELITAPMVGIFHEPEPSLGVGSRVTSGQVVGIIESMRLMNDLRSEVAGTVESVLVEDGMAVEYGQPILRIRPDSVGDTELGV
jgi:acetyl-CoA carboxylase biotin carboxyl carrier protein